MATGKKTNERLGTQKNKEIINEQDKKKKIKETNKKEREAENPDQCKKNKLRRKTKNEGYHREE